MMTVDKKFIINRWLLLVVDKNMHGTSVLARVATAFRFGMIPHQNNCGCPGLEQNVRKIL